MTPTDRLKAMVTGDNVARFVKYFDGNLWYQVRYIHGKLHGVIFEFPVPISDIGTATFLAEDRAILFMRYIRKHLDVLAEARKEQE